MTINGVDYSGKVPSIPAMLSLGVQFAVRYVGYFTGYNDTDFVTPQGKCLTKPEAGSLSQAGISVVSNFEWYAARPYLDPNFRPYTGTGAFDAGASDAREAQKIHLGCGGPPNAPIYFSVDYNYNGGAVEFDYFHGIASVLGLDRVGVYGNYYLMRVFHEMGGLATYYWQTYAWSGGAWYPGSHIHQYANGVFIAGVEVDDDVALVDQYGQWSTVSKPEVVNKFMQQQFDDIWYNPASGVPAGYQSGIYKGVLAGFLQRKYSACYPLSNEIKTVDWAGNPVLFQILSNGHAAVYAAGVTYVYSPSNQLVFQG